MTPKRSVVDELCRIERAALAQLVENIQRADELLAQLERDMPLASHRVARVRAELYRLPPGVEGGAQVLRLPVPEAAADQLAAAWGEADELAAWGEADDDKREP